MKYTINFRPNGQDQLVISYFDEKKEFSSPDFWDVISYSIGNKGLPSSGYIKCTVGGSDHYDKYYSNNTPEEECESILDLYDIEFNKDILEYDVFKQTYGG